MGIVWSFWKRRLPKLLITKSAKVAARPCVGFAAAVGAASSAFRFCAAARSDDFSVFGGRGGAAGASLAPGRACFMAAAALVEFEQLAAIASRRRLKSHASRKSAWGAGFVPCGRWQAWLGIPSVLTPLARCDAARFQTPRAWQAGALDTLPQNAPAIRPEFKQRLSCPKLVVDAGAQRCPSDRTHRTRAARDHIHRKAPRLHSRGAPQHDG